jgi:hypothetical protein
MYAIGRVDKNKILVKKVFEVSWKNIYC